jgi:hypothetical protein
MAEDSSTLSNIRLGFPLPKVDTLGMDNGGSGNVTRVNSSERKAESKTSGEGKGEGVDVSEKAVDGTNDANAAVTPNYILTGSKLALAHTGFLLLVFLYIRFILVLRAIMRFFFLHWAEARNCVPVGLATS